MKKFLPLIIILFIFVPTFIYTVDEREQAIITQVGEFKRAVTKPGLHFKKPFIEKVTRFEKRILSTDAAPGQYLTLDKKRLVVDFLARWKIEDPLIFFKSVRNLFSANTRIEDNVYSELREADLPSEVQQSVFDRMVAERQRISKRYRSEGEEESAKIRAETNKQKEIILAEAYAKSEKVKGEGDKAATKIYSDSYTRDPEFYEFMRKLDAYDKIIDEKSVIFLPLDSNLLDLIRKFD